MSDQQAFQALRDIYRAEFRCPTGRIDQASPYVSRADTSDATAMREMAREDREHLGWLVDLLIEHVGGPPPASYATHAADSHYARLETLLPSMIRDEQTLISTYQAAAPALSAWPDAAAVAGRILQRHTRHLDMLKRLEHPSPAAAH